MVILNLGCGTKTCSHPDVVNIDWSPYLYIKRHCILRYIAPLFIGSRRLATYKSLPDNILIHNLKTKLPFEPNSADVVYHSHLLEHFDRNLAPEFIKETLRVLKPGGIQRIVVPDFEKLCREYLAHISLCETDRNEIQHHDTYIARMIEHFVRIDAFGSEKQRPFRRFIERILLGDARRRGQTHQWMYDNLNLRALLLKSNYSDVRIQQYNASLIPDWNTYGLDLDENNKEYKPGSLYIEAIK